VGWTYAEFALVALAAMASPTTLSFCVLALVLGERPRRTGSWFYVGAFGATLAIGVIAAFVLGNHAASEDPSQPKTWVAVVDVIAAVALVVWMVWLLRRPPNPKQVASMVDRMGRVADSPIIAVVGAGAALANPGGFIPLALKVISETNPNAVQYIALWVVFTVVSLLPLAAALIMLTVAREKTMRGLHTARDWLIRNARKVAAVLVFLLAASLLRSGLAGLF
jgi:hypothetical protein